MFAQTINWNDFPHSSSDAMPSARAVAGRLRPIRVRASWDNLVALSPAAIAPSTSSPNDNSRRCIDAPPRDGTSARQSAPPSRDSNRLGSYLSIRRAPGKKGWPARNVRTVGNSRGLFSHRLDLDVVGPKTVDEDLLEEFAECHVREPAMQGNELVEVLLILTDTVYHRKGLVIVSGPHDNDTKVEELVWGHRVRQPSVSFDVSVNEAITEILDGAEHVDLRVGAMAADLVLRTIADNCLRAVVRHANRASMYRAIVLIVEGPEHRVRHAGDETDQISTELLDGCRSPAVSFGSSLQDEGLQLAPVLCFLFEPLEQPEEVDETFHP